MGKKKKKKSQNDFSVLAEVDNNLNQTYDELMHDIHRMQTQLIIVDAKAKKKLKKKKKKELHGNMQLYNNDEFRAYTRRRILKEMEDTNFFDKIEHILKDLVPTVIIIARLVASLILSILSMDIVKINIKPKTLARMNMIYQAAMAIG